MAETALDLITSSMRKAGVLSRAEAPTNAEAVDGLRVLNDVIGTMSNNGLLVWATESESFPLSGGTGSYTIGSSGTFDTSRPMSILRSYIRDSGGVDSAMSSMSVSWFSGITDKDSPGRPRGFFYDNAYPLGTLTFWPVPDQDYTLFLVSQKPITELSALTTELSFPPGWGALLKDALAIRLAPEYGVQTPQETLLSYREGMSSIQRQKARSVSLDKTPPPKDWNVYTGWD